MNVVVQEKEFFFYLCRFLACNKTPCNKKADQQWEKNKTNKNLITCISSVYMGDTQEIWGTLPNGPRHLLRYHVQLKAKENGQGSGAEGGLWEVPRQSTVSKCKAVKQIQVFAFYLDNSFPEIWSSFFYWYREGDTLTNGDFPYTCKKNVLQRANLSGFQSLSWLFLKNH